MYTVYLITNQINSKKYVGVTKRNYLERYKEHLHSANSGSTSLIHCAMRKYGTVNFQVSILESDVPDEVAGQREQHYIAELDTFYKNGHGYNMTLGGNGTVGYVFTDDDKRKISDGLRGHVFPESRNRKIQLAMTGRQYKQEWRDALSASRIGRFTGEQNPFYGKHHSEQTKTIVSDKNTKHHVVQIDPDTLEIIQVFKNAAAAGRWVVETGLTSAKPSTCEGRISEVCRANNLNCTAYTYKWQFEERLID